MFDVGSGEVLVILVVALLLFGGKLPDMARSLGRSVGELKRGLTEAARPLADAQSEMRREVERDAVSPAGGSDGAKPAA